MENTCSECAFWVTNTSQSFGRCKAMAGPKITVTRQDDYCINFAPANASEKEQESALGAVNQNHRSAQKQVRRLKDEEAMEESMSDLDKWLWG